MALLMAGKCPEYFKAIGSYVPITDLKQFHDQSEFYRDGLLACCSGSVEEMMARSPITYLDTIAKANIKIFHGKFDPEVSVTHSIKLFNMMMEKYPESERLEWNRDRDNFEVLCRSDILISDFSGVVFDFCLVYDKPVIYTNPNFDLSLYDAWWLDDELWTVSALERIGVELTEDKLSDLGALIEDCIGQSRFAQGREQVRAETWANYGTGAEKAAEYLIAQYKMTKRNN